MLTDAALTGVSRSPNATARNKILPILGTVVALTLQAPAAASVNTQEWKNIAGTTVTSVDKDGRLTAANLTLTGFAGVLKAAAGVVAGSATTTDLPEGTNLYYTDARARAAITGTLNRITVTVGVVDISASYIGQASITTLGTVTTGTWTGTAIADAYISSAATWNAKEPAIAAGTTAQYWRGDKSWQTLDKTAVGLGNVENTALSTWAGSANITTLGTIGTGTWNATAIADGKIASALTGKTYNALTLTAAAVGFTIAGGTTSKTLTVPLDATVSGTNTGDQTSVSGNAGTATALQTARLINTVSFNGTADITVTAAAGTLTGATLAAGVTASSLTSVGTLTALTVSGTFTVSNTGVNNIAGNLHIGSASSAARAFRIAGITLSGDNQIGALISPTFTSASTTSGTTMDLTLATAASAFTVTNGYCLRLETPSIGAASAITTNYALKIENQTGGGTNYAIKTGTGLHDFGDDLKMTTVGKGLYVKEGSNATMGTATLVLGTATVNTTKVTANSRIFLCSESLGTITSPVAVAVTARTAGTSFTITSANLTDTSVIAWIIVEPA